MNAPDCAFRGREMDFKENQIEDDIEIIKEHSSTCQFKPGNSLYNFQKNPNLRSDTRNYKTMKIEIEKKTRGRKLVKSRRGINLDQREFHCR